ncbi:MAG TPA: ABC transporter substrate-binding protein [Pyrinomonadaceae bacterium]|jgi:branched-chain amino acid transport system substrate-binding protein
MRRTLLTFGLIAALLASYACVRKDGSGTGGSESGPIIVGLYGDLSGQTSSFGQSTRNGAQMAVEEINAAGGINGRQVKLLVEDDQGQPAQAATVVTKLINQDKVHAVLGEVASTNSLAAAPVAQSAKVPMITPSSTNPKVTEVGDYIFRVCFIDPFQGGVMAKFAANTLKAKTAAVLGDFNSDYSKGMTQYFEEEFNRDGGRVIVKQNYTQTDPDFKAQLTSIRNANPDVIFVPGYYGQVGVIAKQARELGIQKPLLGGDGWDAPQLWDLGGEALANSYISNHYSIDDPSPLIQKFVSAYRARYNGLAPDAIAALGYDAMNVLADSIKRAGSTDPTKLRDAIAQTKNFAGVTGNITLNEKRNAVKPAVVLKLEPAGRKFIYVETIQPEGAATTTATPAAATSPSAASSPAASPAASKPASATEPPPPPPASNKNTKP